MTEPLRIASWNIESIRAHHDQLIDWIDSNVPDVVCLQETRADATRFPAGELRRRGFEVALHGGGGGQGGVALASRRGLDDVVFGIPGAVAPLAEPRSISASVDGLRVHTCYAPNGRKVGTRHHEIKLAWLALFAAWLSIDRDDHPNQLVAADLNIAPTDLDVWEPQRYRKRNLTSPPERAAFETLLDDGALVDVIRDRFGDQRVFTWWNRRSDFYETDRGWRLDHVLASPAVSERISALHVDRAERGRDGSADHAPILVTLTDA